MKTNVSVAGNGSSPRGSKLRDMPASLAWRHEGRMKEGLHVFSAANAPRRFDPMSERRIDRATIMRCGRSRIELAGYQAGVRIS